MDIFISVLLLVGGVIFALWISAKNRKRDSEALDSEVTRDFEEEFELTESSAINPSSPEMEDLIEWLEEDMKEDQSLEDEDDVFEIR
jgi:hypothetical protein